jgi:hypothetical protein
LEKKVNPKPHSLLVDSKGIFDDPFPAACVQGIKPCNVLQEGTRGEVNLAIGFTSTRDDTLVATMDSLL